VTDVSLFDPAPYQERKSRKPRERVPEQAIRLFLPWVLLRYRKHPPQAHLTLSRHEVDPKLLGQLNRNHTPNAIPRCQPKKMFSILPMDGNPAVLACAKCLKYAEMNRIPVERIER
jgi:hypothetical protein